MKIDVPVEGSNKMFNEWMLEEARGLRQEDHFCEVWGLNPHCDDYLPFIQIKICWKLEPGTVASTIILQMGGWIWGTVEDL